MNLSAEEAINRVNESVTVEMLVQKTKSCTGSCQVFLDSEQNHRDPKNLGVVITVDGRPKFTEVGIDDPTAHFKGKTIQLHAPPTYRYSGRGEILPLKFRSATPVVEATRPTIRPASTSDRENILRTLKPSFL